MRLLIGCYVICALTPLVQTQGRQACPDYLQAGDFELVDQGLAELCEPRLQDVSGAKRTVTGIGTPRMGGDPSESAVVSACDTVGLTPWIPGGTTRASVATGSHATAYRSHMSRPL